MHLTDTLVCCTVLWMIHVSLQCIISPGFHAWINCSLWCFFRQLNKIFVLLFCTDKTLQLYSTLDKLFCLGSIQFRFIYIVQNHNQSHHKAPYIKKTHSNKEKTPHATKQLVTQGRKNSLLKKPVQGGAAIWWLTDPYPVWLCSVLELWIWTTVFTEKNGNSQYSSQSFKMAQINWWCHSSYIAQL